MRSSILANDGNAIDCLSEGSSAPDSKALAAQAVSGAVGSPGCTQVFSDKRLPLGRDCFANGLWACGNLDQHPASQVGIDQQSLTEQGSEVLALGSRTLL